MKDNPVFSIVTVCYNSGETIRGTLDSVLRQKDISFENVEHIVVDGSSTDNTKDIVLKYPNVYFVSEEDNGIYDAMNKGIKLARGKYIGILNADDWYEPNALQLVYQAFKSSPASVLVHGNMNMWSDHERMKVARPKLTPWRKYLGMPLFHPTFFVKREAYEKYGAFDDSLEITADYDFYLRLHRENEKMIYLDKVLANFRVGGVSCQKWAIKERVKVRVQNGQPVWWAFILTLLLQVKKKVFATLMW